jgi:hypothetical protein
MPALDFMMDQYLGLDCWLHARIVATGVFEVGWINSFHQTTKKGW